MTLDASMVINKAVEDWRVRDGIGLGWLPDHIISALAAAGIGTYDTATHAAVPRELTRRMAEAIDVAPIGEGSLMAAWQPSWGAAITAAEAEAQGDAT